MQDTKITQTFGKPGVKWKVMNALSGKIKSPRLETSMFNNSLISMQLISRLEKESLINILVLKSLN